MNQNTTIPNGKLQHDLRNKKGRVLPFTCTKKKKVLQLLKKKCEYQHEKEAGIRTMS